MLTELMLMSTLMFFSPRATYFLCLVIVCTERIDKKKKIILGLFLVQKIFI